MEKLKPPFPWFGGKSRAAPVIWERLGNVPNYIEPFAGGLATLLLRPHTAGKEVVNDADMYIANFWRAMQADPAGLAAWCDWPTNEADLTARHQWLVDNAPQRLGSMLEDPGYYDLQIAGWWVWGLCQWVGGKWCGFYPSGKVHRRRPHVPDVRGLGLGVLRFDTQTERLAYFQALAARLRHTKVFCGDWSRCVKGLLKRRPYPIGILLDPPYKPDLRDPGLYRVDSQMVAQDVKDWAIANGDNPDLRIALCGYEGEHDLPDTWESIAWSAPPGFNRKAGTNDNARLERIWFSPHCLKPGETPAPASKPRKTKAAPAGTQLALFDE